MRDLISDQSAIRSSTTSTAAGSSTVDAPASQLHGARPVPVPSILANQNTPPSVSASDYTPDFQDAQVKKEAPFLLLKEAALFDEKEKTKLLQSPKPRTEQPYRYLLDAARNLKEGSNPSLWKRSFSLIARHLPQADEYGEVLSLHDQPSASHKQTLTVKKTDAIVAAVTTSVNDALFLPLEFNNEIDRLVKGYLQWRKTTTEPISISCFIPLLKNLHRNALSSNSIEDDNGIHEHLAEIVSDKNIALSEASKLEKQSPLLALFMYKLMENMAPVLTVSLGVDSKVLHKKPEVCALLAATLQCRSKVIEALTRNGGDVAQLQQQLLEIDAYQLQPLLPLLLHDRAWTIKHLSLLKEMDAFSIVYLLPLLQHNQSWTTKYFPLLKKMNSAQLLYFFPLLKHDQAWTTEHFPFLNRMNGAQLQHLFPLLQHDKAWTTKHFPLLNEMMGTQLQYLFPLLQHDQAWTTKHLPLLKNSDRRQLQYLFPLLKHDQAWTTNHLPFLLKEMSWSRLQYLFPLFQHDQEWTTEHLPLLKTMDSSQLQYLFPLLQHDQEWTTKHFPLLKAMDVFSMKYLLPFLKHDQLWTTENLSLLKKMDAFAIEYLFPLLQHDQAWTSRHLPLLKEMNAVQLLYSFPLLQHEQAWTTEHLTLLKEMNGAQLQNIFPLLQHDQVWTTEHFPLLKTMDADHLQILLPLLRYNKAWTTENLHHLQKKSKDEFYQLARSCFLKVLDTSSGGFTSAANPYAREVLSIHNQDIEELTGVLKTHGASRSTLHPEREIASYLTEKFKHNYQQIPNATFGVENEMFIPGIPESDPSEIENELNDRLGLKDKKYHYAEDGSLSTDVSFAAPPIEQITSILDSPEDIQRLQSTLSILNDWGAFINHTAGVHIHTGIQQWKAADCLKTLEEKSKNRFLRQWDKDLTEQLPGISITPYQLLFMKQFLVNMVSMQKNFYLVSRKSSYSQPNGPMNENELDQYYQNVSRSRDYKELLVDVKDRHFNVNLRAYGKHGTIEVRGFTKKNSDHMEVDPNLPVRDLIFMQEVLIKVLHDTKHILLSGASPDDRIEVRPSIGLTEIVEEYVQDAFLLEIIHALGQRNPEQRVKTMEAIVQDKDLIASETLQKIRESQATLLEGDRLAQHFLTVLDSDAQWDPSFVKGTPLNRINSLRSMADAGFSGHKQKP